MVELICDFRIMLLHLHFFIFLFILQSGYVMHHPLMKSKEQQLENPDKCIQIINEVMEHASTNTFSQFILYFFSFIDACILRLGNKGFYGFLILLFFWVKTFVSASLVSSEECKIRC